MMAHKMQWLAGVLVMGVAMAGCERHDSTSYDPRIDGIISPNESNVDLSILEAPKHVNIAAPTVGGAGGQAGPTAASAPAASGPAAEGGGVAAPTTAPAIAPLPDIK